MRKLYPALRYLTAAMCAWECGAICCRGWTFSRLSSRYPWVAPALIAALTVHLLLIGSEEAEPTRG